MENKPYKILQGNMLDVLPTLEPNYFDACITDPPYELGFMGKSWDKSGVAFQKETWEKVFRVLKPGAYLLAFGGSRTYHRIACAIEDAGFEIRDTIMWLYGSGFPKSMNIGLAVDKKNGVESEIIARVKGSGSTGINERGNQQFVAKNQYEDGTFDLKRARNQWAGWGTALKPAYEPVIVARKPVENSVIDNVIKYGCGGINIDACRVPFENTENAATNPLYRKQGNYKLPEKGKKSDGAVDFSSSKNDTNENGRFPANVILTYDETDKQEVIGNLPDSKGGQGVGFKATDYAEHETATNFTRGDFKPYNDDGNACRYFYCAKASKKDRDEGLDAFEEKTGVDITGRKENTNGLTWDDGKYAYGNAFAGAGSPKKNIHPTVKPIELMQYLIRLVLPPNGKLLDCFAGSGSTGKACMFENRERNTNYEITMVELTPDYIPIIEARCEYAINKYEYDEKIERQKTGQLSLFDFESEE